jgi:hypothetical protein
MVRPAGLIVALLALWSHAVPAVEGRITGVELTVSYEEPRINADRSALGDLKKTTVYWHWKGKTGEVTRAADVPASKPGGGGTVSVKIVIPVGQNEEREVTIYTTASDAKGNESARSNEVTLRIDRLPPAPPR